MRAAEHEVRLIQKAQGAAAALAEVVRPLLATGDACNTALREVQTGSQSYAAIGFIDNDGRMTCSSLGREMDFSRNELAAAALEAGEPTLQINPNGPVSGKSVVVATNPVIDSGGRQLGVLAISLAHSALLSRESAAAPGQVPPVLMTFNGAGEILTSSVGFETGARLLPRDRALAALTGEARTLAFTAATESGAERVYSVVPIIAGRLYALGSWPAGGDAGLWIRALPSFALPSLMWLACLLVTWLAAERMMTQPIRRLREAILEFAKGSRVVDPLDFADAPQEIRELAEAFARMTDTILHDEAELEDMVHQKEVLLREVHHRVKNNLQLIASIMNMQMRQARTPEAKGLMKGLQDRVMSLATIHRGLYQTTGLTDIRADEAPVGHRAAGGQSRDGPRAPDRRPHLVRRRAPHARSGGAAGAPADRGPDQCDEICRRARGRDAAARRVAPPRGKVDGGARCHQQPRDRAAVGRDDGDGHRARRAASGGLRAADRRRGQDRQDRDEPQPQRPVRDPPLADAEARNESAAEAP